MNLEAGFQLIVFLVLFGALNYVMMLKRYENNSNKKKAKRIRDISKLYPKGTFLNIQ